MSAIFTIAPFRSFMEITDLRVGRSNLQIDPAEYERILLRDWPGTVIYPQNEYVLLEWGLIVSEDGAEIIGVLADQQRVSLYVPYAEFFLWHRRIIPSQHQLYLFNDSSWDPFELKPDTTLAEIEKYIDFS